MGVQVKTGGMILPRQWAFSVFLDFTVQLKRKGKKKKKKALMNLTECQSERNEENEKWECVQNDKWTLCQMK